MKIIVHIGERTLEFPDDTPDDVIEATAKQYIGMNKKPDASMTTPKTGSGLAGMQKGPFGNPGYLRLKEHPVFRLHPP